MEGFKMENPIHPWMIWGVPTHHLRKHPKEGNFSVFDTSGPKTERCENLVKPLDSISFQIANPYETPGVRGSSLMMNHGYI